MKHFKIGTIMTLAILVLGFMACEPETKYVPVTKYVTETVTVNQTATTQTNSKVYFWQQNTSGSDYSLYNTNSVQITSETTWETIEETYGGYYTGFSAKGFTETTLADDTNVLNIFYDRKVITYTYYVDDEVYSSGKGLYGSTLTAPSNPGKTDYWFIRWRDENETALSTTYNKSSDTSYYAYFKQAAEKYGNKETPTAVGDIVFSDGSAIAYDDSTIGDLSVEQKAAAVSVIFYVGTGLNNDGDTTTSRTLGVGLYNSYYDGTGSLRWCSSSANAYSKNITTIQCTPSASGSGAAGTATFTGVLDGSSNYSLLKTYLSTNSTDDTSTSTYYPAWDYAENYGTNKGLSGTYATGWYMPSLAELCYVYRNKTVVNQALSLVGGNSLANSYYWSASQYASYNYYAWYVYLGSGSVLDDSKYYYYNVLCVRAF